MARQKKEWNLEQHVGNGLITTEPETVKVKGKNGAADQTGTVQIVARVLNVAAFVKIVEAIVNAGRKPAERIALTFEWLIMEFVNSMIIAQERSRLNVLADPLKAVVTSAKQMIDRFKITDESKIKDLVKMLATEVLDNPSDEVILKIVARVTGDDTTDDTTDNE